MMRFKPLLAALLMLLPVPALADVTAHYAVKDKSLTIEAESGGNVRLTIEDKVTLIRRDGVDYLVVKDAAGASHVARVADLLTMMRAQMQGAHPPRSATDKKTDFVLVQGGSETVAGYPGTVWKIGPAAAAPEGGNSGKAPPPGNLPDMVVSPDPALAPVGGFLKHLVDMAAPMILQMAGETNFVERAGELFAKGAPIRIGPLFKLTAVETGEIADDHFLLPGPVLSAGEFLEAVDPSKAAQALPPAP
jgi:hypothetical protein